jgi:hypothetical protein
MKFYLIDCRPESSAQEQGKIPISVSLSPETFDNPAKMKEREEMFESLRGSVHICIMGEGYAALPALYGHRMTKGLAGFIKQDDSRINQCARFFLSRGFPFVSILEGGFAAAHAYLCREGPKNHLRVSDVLTDYDPEISMFAEFERLHNSTGRDKGQLSLQNLFDSGMTALTKNSMRFESLASELSSGTTDDQTVHKSGQRNVVARFFGGTREELIEESEVVAVAEEHSNAESHHSVSFLNPFARKTQSSSGTSFSKSESSDSIIVESVEFDDDGNATTPSPQIHPEEPTTSGPCSGESIFAVKNSKTHGTGIGQNKTTSFGFGAALNNPSKSQMTTAAPVTAPAKPLNPFARFGSLGTKGLNQFRKNTMARMMTTETQSEQSSSSQPMAQSKRVVPDGSHSQIRTTDPDTGNANPDNKASNAGETSDTIGSSNPAIAKV